MAHLIPSAERCIGGAHTEGEGPGGPTGGEELPNCQGVCKAQIVRGAANRSQEPAVTNRVTFDQVPAIAFWRAACDRACVMPRTVDEIMNRELLAVRPDTAVREVRRMLQSYVVGAVPVIDDGNRPLGVISLRDVLDADGTAGEHMTKPAMCISVSTTIDHAARHLARTDRHHLIVVDGAGAAVGMLSTLDLLRALLGMPARHPPAFPHWDETTQVSWTDDRPFDVEGCATAPDVPGFLLIVSGMPGERDTVVWTEPCDSVRARAIELVSEPATRPTPLLRHMSAPGLRYRAAAVLDEAARERIAAILRDRFRNAPPPGAT